MDGKLMNPKVPVPVNISTGDVRIKGHGSSAMAQHHTGAITQGVEHAVRDFSQGTHLQRDLHLDQLKIRIPAGANEQQITDSVRRALTKSLQHTGGDHE